LSQISLETTWSEFLGAIGGAVGPQRFQLWFKNTRCLGRKDGKLVIGVPNLFVKEWLEEKFSNEIAGAVEQVCGGETEFALRIDGRLFREARKRANTETGELLKSAAPKRPAATPPEVTLDSFVVGSCNRVAYGAARAVSDNPGEAYNPLFLHGSVGLGKTHLLRGICHTVRTNHPAFRVAYMSCESFTNQFIMALKTHSLDAFRERIRRLDLLVIDDIHFLANKNKTQEEFLDTFKHLSGLAKQIVMASDAHPKHLKSIRNGLTTRFMSGLVVEIAPPSYATRMKIHENKLIASGVRLAPELIKLVAKRVSGSVRDLEGACNLLRAYQNLTNVKLDAAAVKEALRALADSASYVAFEDILREVAARFDIEEKAIVSSGRSRDVAQARHVFMYLARELAGASYGAIGEFLGGRSHTTVMAGCRKIRKALVENEALAALERSLRASLARTRR